MGHNPTRFVYVVQVQIDEDELYDPYLLAEAYTSRHEACKRMIKEAKSILDANPIYKVKDGSTLDDSDANVCEIELEGTSYYRDYLYRLEVLELELYNTIEESEGETK